MRIRQASPNDYSLIIGVLDLWWGGRPMTDMLPRLFLTHFCETSFIAELDSEIIGFLIGFLSQSYSEEAYIHFVGIHPDYRKKGIGSALYRQFFETAQAYGRLRVKCVTAPVNKSSIAYHLRMGFVTEPSETQEDGVPYHVDYDGEGEHRVLFVKHLSVTSDAQKA
ncbi:GNAT family N-acetyltransferase [Pseudocalidococcus azoricus]|uniref:GNAT family N-acetyltransferase n=1 Tax=Pseudocalidococcus azoricus TaxID=3110322 RepID=UPI00389A90A4